MARRVKVGTASLTAVGNLVDAVDLGDKAPVKVRAFLLADVGASGGTVQLQVSGDGTNWASAGSATVNADGVWTITADGPGRHWRLRLTARTDGTYSAGVIEFLC
jgi:hypothetical protein